LDALAASRTGEVFLLVAEVLVGAAVFVAVILARDHHVIREIKIFLAPQSRESQP
jgi:hypothetical protein